MQNRPVWQCLLAYTCVAVKGTQLCPVVAGASACVLCVPGTYNSLTGACKRLGAPLISPDKVCKDCMSALTVPVWMVEMKTVLAVLRVWLATERQ